MMIRPNRFVLLILIGISVFSSFNLNYSSAATQTVWGPANGYRIAYIHSIDININDSLLVKEENLPVTEFKIDSIYSNGYNYSYFGYGDVEFKGTVNIEDQIVGSEVYNYPTGSFPVLLPLTYDGTEKWIDVFKASYPELLSVRNTSKIPVYYRIDRTPEIADDLLIFDFTSNLNPEIEEFLLDLPTNLPMVRNNLLNGTFHDGSFEIKLSYKKQTGVLFEYTYLIEADRYIDSNGVNLGKATMAQSIEFVMLIPPTFVSKDFFSLTSSLLLTIILLLLIIRKRN